MTKLRVLLLIGGAVCSGAALAQSNADKARLDEFTPQAAETSVAIEQVPDQRDAVPLPQLSSAGERGSAEQIGRDQARTAAGAPALSARNESRPLPATPLGGADRCDPHAEKADKLAVCRRVIERRAADFQKERAPALSPEAALLAIERAPGSLASGTGTMRKADAADPDRQSSQELAAVTLAAPTPTPQSDPRTQAEDQSLSDAVAALVVQIVTGKP